jgi:hypothetical protein
MMKVETTTTASYQTPRASRPPKGFDRVGHEERIKLDEALETLDPRARHIIEKRWLINEYLEHVTDYEHDGRFVLHDGREITVLSSQANPSEHEELAALFGVSRQRIGQIETVAIAKLKAQNPKIDLPSFDPHFVTARWNTLTPQPRIQPEWCGIGALERLWEPKIVRRWSKPAIYEHGWSWCKPIIVDEGWEISEGVYVHGAQTFPKRNSWPYPRPKLRRGTHIRIAYLHPWGERQSLYEFFGNAGDAAKVMRIVRWERGRRPPGKPARRWRYINPAGNLIPIDFYWPSPWRFPGWYPRPRKRPKERFCLQAQGRVLDAPR